jgi:mRNA turnover protein 4
MIEGSVGLLMSTLEPNQVIEIFDRMKQKDYARTGCRATDTVIIPAGPVKQGDHLFPNNMEVQLRQLGMPTRLVQGVVTLDKDYTICKKDEILNAHQSQLLKHFYIQMAEFRIVLKAHWFNGQLERLSQ